MNIANSDQLRLVLTGADKWLRDNLASRRSRFLVAVLIFLVVASGLAVLASTDASVLQSLKLQQMQLAKLQQLGGSDAWQRSRTETDLARVRAEGRLWEAETSGLAQANFQTWITDSATLAGIGPIDVRISINASANNPLKLRQLSAQIHGRFDAVALFKFARAIAAQDHLLVVDRLEVQTVPAPYFEMLLETYLRPDGNA
jgi:hypothetical protein